MNKEFKMQTNGTDEKRAPISLDKKDIQILQELDLNSRSSYSIIGKKVGKSKEFVRSRVKKLIYSGAIRSFITSIVEPLTDCVPCP